MEPLPALHLKLARENAKMDTCVHEALPQQSNHRVQRGRTHEMANSAHLALLGTGVVSRHQIHSNTPVVLTTHIALLDRQQLNPCLMVTTQLDKNSIHTLRRRCAYLEMLLTFRSVLQEQ